MIYLDNAATTFTNKECYEYVGKILNDSYGNPSSVHSFGNISEKNIDSVKEDISTLINCSPREVIFTSGGTESNNLAIIGLLKKVGIRKKHILTTKLEHASIYSLLQELIDESIEVEYINVNRDGLIDLNDLSNKLRTETLLVSITHVNSEIGTIQNIEAIGKIVKEKSKAYYHVDCVQSFGKLFIDFYKTKADLLSFSGHKIHAFKGIGGLIIKSNVQIKPLLIGGSQQNKLRPGTENLQGIISLGYAIRNNIYKFEEIERIKEMKTYLIDKLKESSLNYLINSPIDSSPFILSISFFNLKGEALVHSLAIRGVIVSTRSACSSKSKVYSYVLEGISVSKDYIQGTIRISLSKYNTIEEMEMFYNVLVDEVNKQSKIMKGVKRVK